MYVISAMFRCYLFPTRVLYSTLYAAEEYIDMFPAYYIFNTLLLILQFLNVVWTIQLLRVQPFLSTQFSSKDYFLGRC